MLAYLELAMRIAPLLIQAGKDIAPFVPEVYNKITSGEEPTLEDWDRLYQKESELRAVLQEPLPD